MSTYITLTGTDNTPLHIKKSAIEMVHTEYPQICSIWGCKPPNKELAPLTKIELTSGKLTVLETYTEVVKMLR